MAPTAWQSHLASYRASHPKLTLKQCMKGASKTYERATTTFGNVASPVTSKRYRSTREGETAKMSLYASRRNIRITWYSGKKWVRVTAFSALRQVLEAMQRRGLVTNIQGIDDRSKLITAELSEEAMSDSIYMIMASIIAKSLRSVFSLVSEDGGSSNSQSKMQYTITASARSHQSIDATKATRIVDEAF